MRFPAIRGVFFIFQSFDFQSDFFTPLFVKCGPVLCTACPSERGFKNPNENYSIPRYPFRFKIIEFHSQACCESQVSQTCRPGTESPRDGWSQNDAHRSPRDRFTEEFTHLFQYSFPYPFNETAWQGCEQRSGEFHQVSVSHFARFSDIPEHTFGERPQVQCLTEGGPEVRGQCSKSSGCRPLRP